MKKNIFALAAILVAFTGCLKDEPYVNPTPGPEPPTPVVEYAKVYINEISCGEKKIEIYNPNKSEVDITGYVFTKDDKDTWTVPAAKGKIAAGGFVVYTAKQTDPAEGPAFGLSGTKGFDLKLADPDGKEIDHIDNLTAPVQVADEETFGRMKDGDAKWVLFSAGTIGASNAGGTLKNEDEAGSIYINEISCGEKKIEIFNSYKKEVDITGYVFTKDSKDTWTVPADKGKIPAGGFVVYTAKQADPADGPTFGLSGTKGFDLKLADADGNEIDHIDNLTAPVQVADDETYGRSEDGGSEWVLFSAGTIGASNAGGTVKEETISPVCINEISCGEKKIEIYNPNKSEVDITGYVFTKDDKDTWTVPEGMGAIPAGGFVVYTAKQADPADGPTFGLSGTKGFDLKLADPDGNEIDHIDNLTATVQVADEETFGRSVDGGENWVLFSAGTIGASNNTGTIKE